MPVISTTWEADIGRITVQGHSRQKISKTPISINNSGTEACTVKEET
jgi:hypothetical protein